MCLTKFARLAFAHHICLMKPLTRQYCSIALLLGDSLGENLDQGRSVRYRKVFSAGASLYGVADCELLAQETHKFESRYLDGLIGPYPEKKEVYKQRSPIHSVDKFSAPVILFQASSSFPVVSCNPLHLKTVRTLASVRDVFKGAFYTSHAKSLPKNLGKDCLFRRQGLLNKAWSLELSIVPDLLDLNETTTVDRIR